MLDSPNPGEAGGIFAGIVAAVIALGHGLRWWLGWTDRRASTRAAKLQAWQCELDAREHRLDNEQKAYWATVQGELSKLRNEHAALLRAYQLIAAALAREAPDNHALRQADEILRSAFPLEATIPGDMIGSLMRMRRPDEQPEDGDPQ